MILHIKFLLAVLTLATVLLAGCGGQDTPVEQAEEEAEVEEVVEEETTQRDIASEGCPEGQVSNEAGTECRDIEEVQKAHAPPNVPNPVEAAGRRADEMGLTPEQKQNNMAQAASRELGLQEVDPRAIDVYNCLVDEGMLQVSQAEQDAISDRLVQEKGLYDIREMMGDVFEEAVGTDCGYKDLSDIRRN